MKAYFLREIFILRCFAALLQRDFNKYFTVGGITYWLGASGLYRAAKPTYFFCRYVDDLADGDRELPSRYKEFSSFIKQMNRLVQNPEVKGLQGIELVLVDALRKLIRKSSNPVLVKKELTSFLESMLTDYNRRLGHTLLSQSALDELYDNSFSSVLQLTFVGTGTELEREHIRHLGLIQGKLYALQDLDEDLAAGIINVPEELIKKTGLSIAEIMSSPASLQKTEAFQEWRLSELMLCDQYLRSLQWLVVGRKVRRIISILTDPLEGYLKLELAIVSKGKLQWS